MGALLLRRRCFLLLCVALLWAVSVRCSGAAPHNERTVTVVGAGECLDCAEKNIKTTHAFKGLHATIKCKTIQENYEPKGVGDLDDKGEFSIQLPTELLRDDGELKDECFVQLHSTSNAPCPDQNGLNPSKLTLKSKENGKHTFGATGKLSFSTATCASAFLWPYFKHHFYKYLPWHKPYIPPSYQPPIYTPPIYKPPVYKPPVYKPIYKPPAYKPPIYKPPVYKPPIYKPPVYKPPIYKPPAYKPPIYKPPAYKPPIYKPPVYKPPIYKPPIYKPPAYKPPIYKPPVYQPPTYKPPVYKPPVYKKPCPPFPVYKKPFLPPVPVYKPLPPPIPIYVKPLPPPVPIYIPPIYKKPFPPVYYKPWHPIPKFPPVYKKAPFSSHPLPNIFKHKHPYFVPGKEAKP